MSEIIIIGAGASGLMAARELSRAGKKVRILEAQDRIGGRIHTLSAGGFSAPVELGAEFIHGGQRITLQLLEEYKIPYHKVAGSMLRKRKGKFSHLNDLIPHSNTLEEKLNLIKEDMSVETFLHLYFSDSKYEELCQSIRSFVEGFEAADPSKASTLAFKNEWLSVDEPQYRIEGGYIRLVNALWKECKQRGVQLELETAVQQIRWGKDKIEIASAKHNYSVYKALLTVPLGILQNNVPNQEGISFSPPLPEKTRIARLLGSGAVIKVLLEFKEAFWQKQSVQIHTHTVLENLSFLFSDESIPTWWTQYPHASTLLTGWLSGPKASQYIGDDDALLHQSLESLSSLFKVDLDFLKKQLVAWKATNWLEDPYALGAYSYAVVGGNMLIQELLQPIGDQLYFAGEALHTGQVGTVEAALASGTKVAEEILLGVQHHVETP